MRGKLLGERYELLEVIGYGGMALVYKAKDILLNRLVAVKILKSEFNDNEQFIKKFQRESQAAASLSHNNIVNVFDVGVQDNLHYIVMEYVNGKTLKNYILEKGRIPWQEAIFLAKQITFALDHAHKNNIIHRDIKPQNILLNEEMIPKVTDFGIARAITSSTITLVEETMGSVHYISPEQARGGFVDAKSDLYSLGIIMYEMITGKVPFDNDNTISIAIKHIQEDIIFPDNLNDVPLGLIDIISKLVKKNPIERYSDARELIKDLIKLQNDPQARFQSSQIDSYNDVTRKTPIIKDNHLKKAEQEKNEDEKNRKKQLYKRITIIAVIVLSIILGVTVFALKNYFSVKEVAVPDMSNALYTDAMKMLDDANLDYEIEYQNSDDIEIKHVISQDPEAGTLLKENQIVKLIVSDGPEEIMMPNVINMPETVAKSDLENMGLVVEQIEREFNEDYNTGLIFDQKPSENTKMKKGDKVTLYVSKGSNMTKVPDLIGKPLDEAKKQLLDEGFVIGGTINEEPSDTYEKNTVIAQNPGANSDVENGTVINLTVSKGLVKTKSLSINVSDYVDYPEPKDVVVKVTLKDDEGVVSEAYNKTHKSNENIVVTLKGIGTETYQIIIDDRICETNSITF